MKFLFEIISFIQQRTTEVELEMERIQNEKEKVEKRVSFCIQGARVGRFKEKHLNLNLIHG